MSEKLSQSHKNWQKLHLELKISSKKYLKLITRKDLHLPNFYLILCLLKTTVEKVEDSMKKMKVVKKLLNNT